MNLYSLKFVLAGDCHVGKTCLYRRFMNKGYNDDVATTVGMEFSTRDIPFERITVRAQCWDTAGEERYDSMSKYYYRDSCGAFLVYDVRNRQSFENVKTKWLKQCREYGHDNMPIILIGNKLDMLDDNCEREVTVEECIEFAAKEGMDYIECSAKNGANVEVAFRRVVITAVSLFPDVKDFLDLTGLPHGWMSLPIDDDDQRRKYYNYWTSLTTFENPLQPAPHGLIFASQQRLLLKSDNDIGHTINKDGKEIIVKGSMKIEKVNNEVNGDRKNPRTCCIIL